MQLFTWEFLQNEFKLAEIHRIKWDKVEALRPLCSQIASRFDIDIPHADLVDEAMIACWDAHDGYNGVEDKYSDFMTLVARRHLAEILRLNSWAHKMNQHVNLNK